MKLCWSIVLSLVFVGLAAAGPHALQEHLSRFLGKELSEVQQIRCRSDIHKVTLFLGGKLYEYNYKACKNIFNGMTCVDTTETLPPSCKDLDEISSCIEFKWYVGRNKESTFQICEEWAEPCQKPIQGFIGQSCDRRAAIQSKIAVTVCEVKEDGTEDDCTGTAIMTANEADNSDEDCFCVTPQGEPQTCKGTCRLTK